MIHESNDLLRELEEPEAVRPGSFYMAIFTFCTYIVAAMLSQLIDVRHHSLNIEDANWLILAVLVGLPVIGLPLFLFRKKAGWVICLFYFLTVGLLLVARFFSMLVLRSKYYVIDSNEVSIYVFFGLILLSLLLLFSKSVRRYLGISETGLVITVSVATIAVKFSVL